MGSLPYGVPVLGVTENSIETHFLDPNLHDLKSVPNPSTNSPERTLKKKHRWVNFFWRSIFFRKKDGKCSLKDFLEDHRDEYKNHFHRF